VCAGGLFWTAQMSGPVAAALLTRDGARQAARLLFDEDLGDWSDDEVDAFLEAKDPPRDEGNLTDYQVVMDLIWEAADPKAKRPSAPSAGPGATGGSSPGSPPATSDCSRADAGGLTYRVAWDEFLWPVIERRRNAHPDEPRPPSRKPRDEVRGATGRRHRPALPGPQVRGGEVVAPLHPQDAQGRRA
jgi:hypothetical protein